jgi:O-antigen ligase
LSVSAVLLVSWVLALVPDIPWRAGQFGVPVKDYILQSEEFLICAFVLLAIAFDECRLHHWRSAIGLSVFAALFLANIAFVATGRTALLIAPVLALLLGWRQFGWKGLIGASVLFSILAAAAAWESPYMRTRLTTSINELQAYESRDSLNSTSEHLQFIKESISFVKAAPIVGHGTGSIAEQFSKAVMGQTGAAAKRSDNPHNQILAVAVQLGLIGAGVLLAMWIAHLMLFRGGGLIAWIGIVIVTDNVVSSLVNSHLFDFTQAWLYIFGIGVAGGTALKKGGSGPPAAFPGKAGVAAGGSS